MKRPSQIAHAQKIYNCVDELLMEDVEYQLEQDRVEQGMENSSGLKKAESKAGTRWTMKSKGKKLGQNEKQQLSIMKKTANNTLQSKKQQKFTISLSPPLNQKINQKGDKIHSDTNIDRSPNPKLKRTASHDPNDLQQMNKKQPQLGGYPQSYNSFIGTIAVFPGLESPVSEVKTGKIHREQIKVITKEQQQSKHSAKTSQMTSKKQSQATNNQANPNPPQKQFHLTHDQLQFLSLLYPNQTPQQLMLKLLTYYEQQVQYKNSFQDIASHEETKKKNYFFKSSANLCERGDKDKEREGFEKERLEKEQWLPVVEKMENIVDDDGEQMLNEYTRLKEQCLSALGSQMVQTQLKSSMVQTANVNYYTRQYAMPHIMQLVQQKNQQAQQKLQRMNFSKLKYHFPTQKPQPNSTNTTSALLTTHTSFNQELVHKVYIPTNSRGQCFDMDYEPDPTLFNYVPENQYRRILRDINHLIQKVLLHHRHNSFIKKRNSSLLGGGWNLVLVLFMFFLLVMLYIECFFKFETSSSYLEIVVFFCLSFVIILIMGNAFNNYKKSVKRSSLIKDICQEITNYLEFANCSSKNVKWVLGKDFFWVQIWIYLKKGMLNNRSEKGR